jgi:CelD/BcsL family acetyltransferase involved in cellulose biosynthesis
MKPDGPNPELAGGLEVYRGTEGYAECRTAWQQLAEQSEANSTPTYFSIPGWLDCWSQTAGLDIPHWLFVATDADGNWMGALPLSMQVVRLGRTRRRMLTLAGWPYLDVFEMPAVSQAARVETFVRAFAWCRKELRGWAGMMLRELDQQGQTLPAFWQACENSGLRAFERDCAYAPLLDLNEFQSRPSPRSKSFRKSLRGKQNRLARLGELQFSFESITPEQIENLLLECQAVDEASWKSSSGINFLLQGTSLKFARQTWQYLAANGDLLLGALRLDGRLISYHWGPLWKGTFLSYNLSFVDEFKEFSPGLLLMDAMVDYAESLGVAAFDASRSSRSHPHLLGRYKGSERQHVVTYFYHQGLRGTGTRILRETIRPAWHKVRGKSYPED